MNTKFRKPAILGSSIIISILAFVIVSFAFVEGGVAQGSLIGHGLVIPAVVPARVAASGGPGYVYLNALAFKPQTYEGEFEYQGDEFYNPATHGNYYVADVQLPNHATITRVMIYFYDHSTVDLTFRLIRCTFSEANYSCPTDYSIITSGDEAGIRSMELPISPDEEIDLQNYSYFARVDIPAPPAPDEPNDLCPR